MAAATPGLAAAGIGATALGGIYLATDGRLPFAPTQARQWFEGL